MLSQTVLLCVLALCYSEQIRITINDGASKIALPSLLRCIQPAFPNQTQLRSATFNPNGTTTLDVYVDKVTDLCASSELMRGCGVLSAEIPEVSHKQQPTTNKHATVPSANNCNSHQGSFLRGFGPGIGVGMLLSCVLLLIVARASPTAMSPCTQTLAGVKLVRVSPTGMELMEQEPDLEMDEKSRAHPTRGKLKRTKPSKGLSTENQSDDDELEEIEDSPLMHHEQEAAGTVLESDESPPRAKESQKVAQRKTHNTVDDSESQLDFSDVEIDTDFDKRVKRSSFCQAVLSRTSVLVILLLLQSINSTVLAAYEAFLQHYTIVVMFLTVMVGAGGNAGSQSTIRVIAGLVTKEYKVRDICYVLRRELSIGCACACLVAIICFVRVFVFEEMDKKIIEAEAVTMAQAPIALSLGIFAIVASSSLVGTLLPFSLAAVGMSAEHAGPAIQVIMDIVGVVITCVVTKAMFPPLTSASAASNTSAEHSTYCDFT
eukprot:TRINITY_DN107492_c0_g1_i1.p1 TRINITY_DN107492_c0_g1~~TRINITY_DN107492_c0_g1_i1.p1  ORF type:complete len:489 (-),score=39.19 TRINITY_DN107492_c0_g1_i1:182-1648(-)